MSTEEMKEKGKNLLYNQYGPPGLIIGVIVTIAGLAPDKYEQIKDFTAHIMSGFDNSVGTCIAILVLGIYFNKSFFSAYLNKEKGYATNLKSFEATLDTTLSRCLTVSEGVKEERMQVLDRLGNIESGVSRLLSSLSEHDNEATKIYDVVNLSIIPQLNKLMSFYKEKE